MATLYELTDRYRNVLEIAGMLDEEQLQEALQAIDDEIEVKADGYAKVMKELEMQENAIQEEVKRLSERKKHIKNNRDRMKESLANQMEILSKRKIKTDLFSFNIQANPPSLNVLDDRDIPKEFYIEQEPKLDRRELLQTLKRGDVIKGVEIKQTEGLRIR